MTGAPGPIEAPHRVVIVGGGAGGLELAARLEPLRRSRRVEVTLVDQSLTHIWKPQLHELAAGTLQGPEQEVDYLQQARRHDFRFRLGRLAALDRTQRVVWLDALSDDDGAEIAPRRSIPYDTLVLAVGSVVNDFGTPGVQCHALSLDDAADARRFHRRLLAACARAELQADAPIDIVIVGGGATGVELAAELAEAVPEMAGYGTELAKRQRSVQLHLVEGGQRLVSALPEHLSDEAKRRLEAAGVDVRLSERVTAVEAHAVQLKSGVRLPATLTVWAAGIRGPEVLRAMDGLELGQQGQLLLRPTLQTTLDPRVFALGDCGSVVPPGASAPVPPRAQVAHQQAAFLVGALEAYLDGRPLPAFTFEDRGALVSLGRRGAVGRIVAGLPRSGFSLRGFIARWAYRALQRQHLVTLHGLPRTVLATVGSWLTRRTQPRVKLH